MTPAEHKAAEMRRNRATRKRIGMCSQCSARAVDGKTYCDTHGAEKRSQRRAWRRSRRKRP